MENARRRRFLAWYGQHYREGAAGRAKFMADTGKRGEKAITKGRVTQLFDDSEPFGELAARNLAIRLGLEPDYFEHDHAGGAGTAGILPLQDDEPDLLAAFRLLDVDDRHAVMSLAAQLVLAKHEPTLGVMKRLKLHIRADDAKVVAALEPAAKKIRQRATAQPATQKPIAKKV
jgi:hypothetical protein